MEQFLKNTRSGIKGEALKKNVFKYCLDNGICSVPDIVKGLNYSFPAITKHVNELCAEGFLIDYGKAESKEGRPPCTYGVNPDSCYFVGVDIRWFSLSIGVMNLRGDMLKISSDYGFIFQNTDQTLDEICKQVRHFIVGLQADKNKKIDISKIINVNVNISGRVNPQTGYSFSIFNRGETPLSQIISEKLGYNVTIDNDTRAMAYGEYASRFDNKHSNMLYINIGWGVGIGIVINGEIYGGKSGYSGEIGHLSVFDNEIMCHCGKKGCLETEASGMALHREVIEKIKDGSQSVLYNAVTKGRNISIYDIIDAIVKKEDLLCIEILESIGMKMGKQIANLINIFNPDAVVIGGVLSQTGDYILQPIKQAVRKYSLTLVSRDTDISISKLRDKAGVTGACIVARHRVMEQ